MVPTQSHHVHLGVPEDEPLMLKLNLLFGSTDPDVARSFEMMDIMNVVGDFEDYFQNLTLERRKDRRRGFGNSKCTYRW